MTLKMGKGSFRLASEVPSPRPSFAVTLGHPFRSAALHTPLGNLQPEQALKSGGGEQVLQGFQLG